MDILPAVPAGAGSMAVGSWASSRGAWMRRLEPICEAVQEGRASFEVEREPSAPAQLRVGACEAQAHCQQPGCGVVQDEPPHASGGPDEAAALDEAQSSQDNLEQHDDAAVDEELSGYMAGAWALSCRHFTDCMPPESVTSDHSLSRAASDKLRSPQAPRAAVSAAALLADSSAASSQQQQRPPALPLCAKQQRQQQWLAVRQAPDTAPQPDAGAPSSCAAPREPGLSDAALQQSLLDALDSLEQQPPWDRVSAWLEGLAATGEQDGDAGLLFAHVGSRPDLAAAVAASAAGEGPPSDDGGGLFDAPAWWQEQLVARLTSQREAFQQGSMWGRLRLLAGLAAQRAAVAAGLAG